MLIVNNSIMSVPIFLEKYTGYCVTRVSTLTEFGRYLGRTGKTIPTVWNFSDISKIPEEAFCVVVEFSSEHDYTVPVYKIVRIPKRLIGRFKNLD